MPPRRAILAAAFAAAACAPRASPFAPRRAPLAPGPRVRGGGRGATVPLSAEAEGAELENADRKVEPLVRALWSPAPADAPAEDRPVAPSLLDVVRSEVKKNGPGYSRAAIKPAGGGAAAPSFLDVVEANPTVSKPLTAATLVFIAIGLRNSAVKRQAVEDSREREGGTARGAVRAAPAEAEAAPAVAASVDAPATASPSGVELWSVGYDDAVRLAYEAAGSPRGFDAFRAKYLEETSAMVAKKGLIGSAPAVAAPAKVAPATAPPVDPAPVDPAPVGAAPAAAPPAAPLGELGRDIQGQIDEIDAMLSKFTDKEVKENLGRQKSDLEEMLEFAVQNSL